MTTATLTPTSSSSTGTTPGMSTPRVAKRGNVLVNWITSTDHKTIGYMYLISSFIYFCIGGVMALIIRAQLFAPGPVRGASSKIGSNLLLGAHIRFFEVL